MNEIIAALMLPFLVCLLLTTVLGYLGLHVLKREVIFIDIAVAQVAALGTIAAHMMLHVHAASAQAFACAVVATLTVAALFAVVRRNIRQIPIEAVIGITYAIVAAGALFMIGKSTCGHTHVQEMLTGNLLWLGWTDVAWAALTFALASVGFRAFRGPFQRISDDYDKAVGDGLNVVWWDFLFYAICGIVITVAVRLVGVLVVFCFLIIPATISALFSDKWNVRLIITWLAGVLGSFLGLGFCFKLDFSAGVSVAMVLGLLLVVVSIVKPLIRCIAARKEQVTRL